MQIVRKCFITARQKVLDSFVHRLLNSKFKSSVGKIYFLGSMVYCDVSKDSDVDILILTIYTQCINNICL